MAQPKTAHYAPKQQRLDSNDLPSKEKPVVIVDTKQSNFPAQDRTKWLIIAMSSGNLTPMRTQERVTAQYAVTNQ